MAMAVIRTLLFVSILTTRDPWGEMTPSELVTAEVVGIFTTMLTLLLMPVLAAMICFIFAAIVTKGRVVNDLLSFLESHPKEDEKI